MRLRDVLIAASLTEPLPHSMAERQRIGWK
jgi:hypothetical protein